MKFSLALVLLLVGCALATNGPYCPNTFDLVDAIDGSVVGPLNNGDNVKLDLRTAKINIRAFDCLAANVYLSRVELHLSGPQYFRQDRDERVGPFFLFGDTDGRVNAWSPLPGVFRLDATAYDYSGRPVATVGISFSIENLQLPPNNPPPPPPCPPQNVFDLVDAIDGSVVGPLSDGDNVKLDIRTAKINVRAFDCLALRGGADRVQFHFEGPQYFRQDRTEVVPPFFLFGNTDGRINQWSPIPGHYKLEATAFSYGRQVAYVRIEFNIENLPPPPPPPCPPNVFDLVDAIDGSVVGPLSDGDNVKLNLRTAKINVRAYDCLALRGAVDRVLLRITGPQYQHQERDEQVPPFYLFGDQDGRINPWSPLPGQYRLEATAYSVGHQVASTSIHFSVQNL